MILKRIVQWPFLKFTVYTYDTYSPRNVGVSEAYSCEVQFVSLVYIRQNQQKYQATLF